MTEKPTEKLHKLFTYGTLRPGENLYSWIEPSVRKIQRGWVKGTLHEQIGDKQLFPLANLEGAGMIEGDLLTCDNTEFLFYEILMMEHDAGFEIWEVEVLVETDSGFERALALHYPFGTGPRIAGNDWFNSPNCKRKKRAK